MQVYVHYRIDMGDGLREYRQGPYGYAMALVEQRDIQGYEGVRGCWLETVDQSVDPQGKPARCEETP